MQRRGERALGPYGPDQRGRYRIVIINPTVAPGESPRRSLSFETRREAQDALDAAREALAAREATTVQDAITDYLAHCRDEKRLRPVSVAWYKQVLERLLPADEPLADLDAQAIWAEIQARPAKWNGRDEERPASPESLRAYLRVIRTFCAWAVGAKLLERDPFAECQVLARRRRGKLQLTQDEARRYLRTALEMPGEGPLLASLPLITGARAGELLGARVRDVDAGGRLLWLEGKTGRRPADVLVLAAQERLTALAAGRDSWDPLWTEGRSSVHLLRWVRRVCAAAEVPTVCPHGLRGTWATLALRSGAAAAAVAGALGHSPDVLRQHYAAPGAEAAGKSKDLADLLN